jgi:hypothetical protein
MEIVLILTQDRCPVGVERTIGWKSSWMHLMEHLGEWVLWNLVLVPFGDSVSVGAIWVHGLRRIYHGLRNHFGRTRQYS